MFTTEVQKVLAGLKNSKNRKQFLKNWFRSPGAIILVQNESSRENFSRVVGLSEEETQKWEEEAK